MTGFENKIQGLFAPTPLNMQAIWFGGPEGSTLKTLSMKLARIGINIIEYVAADKARDKRTISSAANVLILNKDMMAHDGTEAGRALADRYKLPWVYAANDLTTLLVNLETKGLLPAGVTAEKLSLFLNGKEIPVTITKLQTDLIDAFKKVMSLNNDQIANILNFLKPEIDANKESILSYVKGKTRQADVNEEELTKGIYHAGTGQQNLASWSRSLDKSYYDGAHLLFRLAGLGQVVRIPPQNESGSKLRNETININFKLSENGRAIFDLILQREMSANTPAPVAPPPAPVAPVARPRPPQVQAPEPPKPVVQSAPPPTPAPAPVAPPAPTPMAVVTTLPTTQGSGAPRHNFRAAVGILIEAAREEHPEYATVTIDIKTGKYKVSRVVIEENEFSIDD